MIKLRSSNSCSLKSIFLETHNINNLYSGFGQFNFNLAKALSEQKEFLEDHKIILNCSNSVTEKELGENLCYNKYWQITRYPFFRIKKKFDLWHSVNQNTKIEPYLDDMPYLLTVHDVNFMEEESGERLDFRINQFKNKIERSNALVYISEYAKKSTHEHFNVPDIPEYVIYNGNTLTNNMISTSGNVCSNRIPNKPFIFSIGQVVEKKNFHTLIDMLKFLPDIDLVIAGDMKTEYADFLTQKVLEYKFEDRVFLLGRITESDKIFFYKNCLAFTFPSLREGFGLPVLEAMTFGKPVFLSTKTSLPEIGGEKSFYWENFDPQYMAEIFNKGMAEFDSDKETFVKAYINHSKKFTWENAAKQYIEVYERILKM
ncbi:glycosyl transferase family 1 [Pseudalgibacter alginicilyticus]|uniref:Glycosyl transferase family 1 n=1 Tax=Pseudalgibacter alginicilyticus TaxID=1736674 RepID=A0A0N7HYG8_9FLAO|nr:glycosyltransferase family 1 protein [Pseudalgibacter alginicilyticus]ALJ05214.1 glycosyl transferase family 1 [Pseudalgibacter alginicilyticus]